MKAIITKYHGPTEVKGSRISATDSDRNTVVRGYEPGLNSDDNHAFAAKALCTKMGWTGTLIMGGLNKDANVWVFTEGLRLEL